MAASFPTSVKSFTTKTDGPAQTVFAAHVNDLQDEVVALETHLTSTIFAGVSSGVPAWASYTPTWEGSGGNPSIGNGTLSGHYFKIGKLIIFEIYVLMGSTTTFGSGLWSWTIPVTAAAATFGAFPTYLLDSGTSHQLAMARLRDTASVVISKDGDSGSGVGATVPFTWANGDSIKISGFYAIA